MERCRACKKAVDDNSVYVVGTGYFCEGCYRTRYG